MISLIQSLPLFPSPLWYGYYVEALPPRFFSTRQYYLLNETEGKEGGFPSSPSWRVNMDLWTPWHWIDNVGGCSPILLLFRVEPAFFDRRAHTHLPLHRWARARCIGKAWTEPQPPSPTYCSTAAPSALLPSLGTLVTSAFAAAAVIPNRAAPPPDKGGHFRRSPGGRQGRDEMRCGEGKWREKEREEAWINKERGGEREKMADFS